MGREAGFSAAPVEMTDFWWGEGTGKGNDRSRSPSGMTSKKGNGESNGKSNGKSNGNGNGMMLGGYGRKAGFSTSLLTKREQLRSK